jgi:hypothetical protein
MFISFRWRTYTAQTPPIEHRTSYRCEHCGESLHVLVRVQGRGTTTSVYDSSGGHPAHQQTAVKMAYENARANGTQAMATAPCPHCNRISTSGEAILADGRKRDDWQRRLQRMVPAALAVLAALAVASPVIKELPYSNTLLFGALALVFGLPVATLGFLLLPRQTIAQPTALAYFWLAEKAGSERYRENGQVRFDWKQAIFALGPRTGSVIGSLAGVLIGSVSLLAAILCFVMYQDQFADLWFVTRSLPVGTKVLVSQEGQPAQNVEVTAVVGDAFRERLRMRKAGSHVVHVSTLDAKLPLNAGYTLSEPALHGWIIAPHAKESDLCISEQLSHYGPSAARDTEKLVPETAPDLFTIPEKFDIFFEEPPEKVDLASGESSATRLTLRARSCAQFSPRVQPTPAVPVQRAPSQGANEILPTR